MEEYAKEISKIQAAATLQLSEGAIAWAPIDWRRQPPNPIVALLRYTTENEATTRIEQWSGSSSGGLVYRNPAERPYLAKQDELITRLGRHARFVSTPDAPPHFSPRG